MKTPALLVALLLSGSSLSAQPIDPSRFERWLLPISTAPVAGANGTFWQSDLWMYHGGSVEGRVWPLGGCFGNACARVTTGFLQPGETRFLAVGEVEATGRPVQYLYVEKNIAADLQMQLHLRNDRGRGNPQVEIPVVRDRDFRSSRITLLNVPAGAAVRTSLRIFSTRDDAPSEFFVRVVPIGLGATAIEYRVQTSPAGRLDGVVVHPAMVDVATPLRGVASEQRVRVEIRPVDPTVRFWAFVSSTDNATQRVTLFTPF